NSFLADGGDGFAAFTEGQARNTSGGYYVSNAIVDYFKAGNTIIVAGPEISQPYLAAISLI
ncbi:hypothetical protein MJH54_32375, partial [Salmonella enterica subsp. enterica serovar Montevideo]|nr:hypothetical protein [Salmonella enterica subsp. enterica serovar Montevideo]